MSYKNILLLSIFCIVLFACKKEDDSDPTPTKSNTELLSGNWIMTNLAAPPPLDTVDIWTGFSSCIKDNKYTFSTDGSGVIDEGTSKCEPSDPQSKNFSWDWANTKETEMKWVDIDDTIYIKEISITSTTFVGNQIVQGLPYDYLKITLTKQ